MYRYNREKKYIMTHLYSPDLTQYTVVFTAHPRGASCFRTVYAENREDAMEGLFKLPNSSNIIEVTDCFPTIRN